jgi:hypothetical protein
MIQQNFKKKRKEFCRKIIIFFEVKKGERHLEGAKGHKTVNFFPITVVYMMISHFFSE